MFPQLTHGSRQVTRLNPHELSHGFMRGLIAVCTLGKYIKMRMACGEMRKVGGGQGRGVLGLYGQAWCPDTNPDLMVEPGDGVYAAIIPPGWGHELRATMAPSQRMAQEAHKLEVEPLPFEALIPEHYQNFQDVFS